MAPSTSGHAPRKQRHTVKRIFDRLVDEHDATQLTYRIVRAYVAERRPEIRIEAGRGPPNAFVPQSHQPGVEAEVDFGDVTVRLAGEQVKLCLFAFRLSYSGKTVHRIFASGGREAFFEGTSTPSQCWVACRPAFYCQPGIDGAHEKGGVEGDIEWFRRNHLVPVPEVNSLAELNAMVDQWDLEDEARRIGSRPRTVGEHFAIEQPRLKPVRDEPFETGLTLSLRVDRYAQVSVRTNRYSVPAHLVGRTIRVKLHASELIVYDGQTEVARHERLVAGLAVALRVGALTADAVALEARKAVEADLPTPLPQPPGQGADDDSATVTFLTERRMAHLPPDNRPLPSVAVYDQLLRRPRPGAERPGEGESS